MNCMKGACCTLLSLLFSLTVSSGCKEKDMSMKMNEPHNIKGVISYKRSFGKPDGAQHIAGGIAWFVFQMQCELGYALTVCVYPFIALDLAKIVVSCIVGALLRKRLTQAGVLKLQNAVSE